MGEELRELITNLIKYALFLSLLVASIILFTWGIKYSLVLILGTLVSLVGFILSSWSLNNTLNHNKGRPLPIIINVFKALIIASLAAFFFMNSLKLGISFLIGFILIFPGLIIHGINLK